MKQRQWSEPSVYMQVSVLYIVYLPAGLRVKLKQSAWYTLGQPAFLHETSCPPSPQLKHSSSCSFTTSFFVRFTYFLLARSSDSGWFLTYKQRGKSVSFRHYGKDSITENIHCWKAPKKLHLPSCNNCINMLKQTECRNTGYFSTWGKSFFYQSPTK